MIRAAWSGLISSKPSVAAPGLPIPSAEASSRPGLVATKEGAAITTLTRQIPGTRFHLDIDPALRVADWERHHNLFRVPTMTVEGFTLFRSHLGHLGADYEPLADYPLTPPTDATVSSSG